MSLQKYVRQVKPRTENYIPPVDKIQSFLFEDIDFPSDILDGFEFTQTDKSF